MQILNYKTRANSSPQGKSKVFFTCHDDDFDAFFESISEDILKTQNCSIWYRQGRSDFVVDDDYLSALDEMQLFVIPVTRRFLAQDNISRGHDLQYALSNHKPILPILVENGLESSFNEICGNLQIVSRVSNDDTSKPYETRLKEFLESVLIGDELASRIRSAFDAYIFLSYRKKDRADAQRLMRLIHSHEYCESMAIWYDEFLVPGEDFNDAIYDAMKKSSLFALVVTPNLVNEKNYVMTTEYPTAIENNMTVFPCEMQATDRIQLEDKYPGIGICNSPQDLNNLGINLKKAINTISLSDDRDPIHRFFLGLAYLEGIDVECNSELALKYINSAADDDLPEAIKQLANMYRLGNGVDRDLCKSINYQRVYVDSLKSSLNKEFSDDKACAYLNALSDLAAYLTEEKRLDEAHSIYEEICTYCVPFQREKNWAVGMLMLAYDGRSQLYRIQGREDDAIQYLNKNLQVMNSIRSEFPDDASLLRMIAVTYNNYGRSYLSSGDYHKAERNLLDGLELFKYLESLNANCDIRRDVSATYGYLGNVYYITSDFNRAIEQYEHMLNINKNLKLELDTDVSKRDYGVALGKYAMTCANLGRTQEALQYQQESLELFDDLVNRVGTFESLFDMYNSLFALYVIKKSTNSITGLHRLVSQSIDIAEKLDSIQQCQESKIALRSGYSNWAELMSFEGNVSTAVEFLHKAIDAGKQAAEMSPSEDNLHAIASAYYNVGAITNDSEAFKNAYLYWEHLERRTGNRGLFLNYMNMAHQGF